jgi:hypothetical protein
MVDANQKIELRLNPGRLATIIESAVVASSEIVAFHFNALAVADLSKPSVAVDVLFRLKGPDLSADQRRAMHESWLLAKAFQELLRSVRHALEEAHVFTALLAKTHKVKSSITLPEFLKPFQSKAAGLTFPALLAAVNETLERKIDFADS